MHYVSGDGRANDNLGVTALYSVFQAEHNALVAEAQETILATNDLAFINQWLAVELVSLPTPGQTLVWDGERLFQAAKFGNETQYQSMVFTEFGLKMQPMLDPFLGPTGYDSVVDPAISTEFLATILRFGDSTYNESFDRLSPTYADSSLSIVDAFLNPLEYAAGGLTAEQRAGAIVRGLTRDVASEVDEFVTDALRDFAAIDLAALNVAYGRDIGAPSLNDARRSFFAATSDSTLKAYTSWNDFAANLRNPESLVNFIAAYGIHETLIGDAAARHLAAVDLVMGGGAVTEEQRLAFLNGPAASTGVDDIDLWIGGLAEKQMPFGGIFGSTFNHIFETQLENVSNARPLQLRRPHRGPRLRRRDRQRLARQAPDGHTDAVHLPGDAFRRRPTSLRSTRRASTTRAAAGADGILGDDLNTTE